MDRRNFFKLVGTASGGVISGACGKHAEEIIPRLVPEEEIVPGVESWHPSVCRECAAGCGTLARVMAADREIEVDGQPARQWVAAVKKIEGNPADPVSGGRLCARGHAALQSLYNPDRIRQPLRRKGARGSGEYEPIPWETALEEAAGSLEAALSADPRKIVYLGQPHAGTRSANISRFLDALGAPPAKTVGVADFAVEREAARRAYGWQGIPVYEIQDATAVLSIGADFLGGWVSPVLYSRRYGHMRQGRRELRGRLIHAGPRFSLTAWNAERWLPVRPGGELDLALGIGHALLRGGSALAEEDVPPGVLKAFRDADMEALAASSGVTVDAMREVAEDLVSASAPLVVPGASIVRENSVDAVVAASALNLLLGRVGVPGGVQPPALADSELPFPRLSSAGWERSLSDAALVLLDGVNPAYNCPSSRESLNRADTVISFSPFLDDSTAYADLVLPDHDPLEQGALTVPHVSPVPSLASSRAFVAPLHDSRPTEAVLAGLAEAVGRPFEPLTVEAGLEAVHAAVVGGGTTERDDFVKASLEAGGWKGERTAAAPRIRTEDTGFTRSTATDGLVFQAYPSVAFGEGSGANRPWLQELPDPTSSAMWGTPVELDARTAESLGVSNGEMVRVESANGSLEAPVYVNPAAIPGVASMALGQGHEGYGRFASGRGANPMEVVGDLRERATGAAVLGPVSVTISKAGGDGRLIQFSRQDRDAPPHRV